MTTQFANFNNPNSDNLPGSILYAPGQKVLWIIAPASASYREITRLPAQVVATTPDGTIEIKLAEGAAWIGNLAPFWVRAEALRAACVECHFAETMPDSQVCLGCWVWDMNLDLTEPEGEEMEGESEEVA